MSKLLPLSLLAVLVAALAVAGCGGQQVTADEVPGAPVALQVPEVTKGGSDALAGNSSSSSSSSKSQSTEDSADADATPTPTPAASGQTGTTGTTQNGNTGGTSGTTQQQTQQDNGTNGQSQGGGGNTFDDFCKNNPGAC